MKLIEYPDRDMLALDVANALADDLTTRLLHHDHASLAVPGGTTPGPVFDALSGAALDWARVHVLPTDERWVPPDHPRSNEKLIRERLLTEKAASASFVPLYRADTPPDAAIDMLTNELEDELPLSILVLGMGGDMHTASLFPGAPGLSEALASDADAVAILRPAGQPELRVSLTAPVLTGALSTHLIVTGDEKRAALERAAHLPPEEAPVALVLETAIIHWAA